jgi:hypothetical protein
MRAARLVLHFEKGVSLDNLKMFFLTKKQTDVNVINLSYSSVVHLTNKLECLFPYECSQRMGRFLAILKRLVIVDYLIRASLTKKNINAIDILESVL